MPKYISLKQGKRIIVKRDRGDRRLMAGKILGKEVISVEARSKKEAMFLALNIFTQMERIETEEKGSTVEASTEIKTEDR